MYDPLKDHGGYKGRKNNLSFGEAAILAGLVVGGSIIWDKWKARKQKNFGITEFVRNAGEDGIIIGIIRKARTGNINILPLIVLTAKFTKTI